MDAIYDGRENSTDSQKAIGAGGALTVQEIGKGSLMVSQAVVVATGVISDGRREVLGFAVRQ